MTLYSIGHSNVEIGVFVDLLNQQQIKTLVDTRSQPYSRYAPQFSRAALKRAMVAAQIEYVYLGDLLGGRPEGEEFYHENGKADYEVIEQAPFYLAGIEQLLAFAERRRVAFMCSEADYSKCHRYRLITRTLVRRGIEVNHILHSGELVRSERLEFEPIQPRLF